MKGSLITEIPISVKAYDIDSMGIVSNIVYIRWFEDIRTRFLEDNMSLSEMMNDGISPILARTEVDYKSPVTIHDKITGRGIVEDMGASKWTMKLEIIKNGKLCCSGKQTGYFFNLKTNKPARVPEKLQTAYRNSLLK